MWWIEQAKKIAKKRSRSKLNTIDDENDEDHELIVNESWLQRNFVAFEKLNDDENDDEIDNEVDNEADAKNNARHSKYVKNAVNSWDFWIIESSWL